MRKPKHNRKNSIIKDPFSYIGFWQFMTFIMLLLLIWFNEFRDIPAFLFNTPSEGINYFRGSLLSAFVLLTAIIIIGNTYLQEQRILNNLISVCSKCHKVRINEKTWEKMEDYISDHSLLSFTHGLCPHCQQEMMQSIKEFNFKKAHNTNPEQSKSTVSTQAQSNKGT